MGVINVTPDSFSDGGAFLDPRAAIAHGEALVADGADILDIGGESTRPGAEPVSDREEQRRVLPVISGLRDRGTPISVDTRRAATMTAAVEAGAAIINDVSALSYHEDSLGVAASLNVPVILMHARGDPRTMQDNPQYDDVVLDVYDYLAARVEAAVAAGIARDRIIVDPGIGFGKTLSQNLALLDGIGIFHGLGCPVMLGASRKSFIGKITGEARATARLPGSLGVAVLARLQGVQIFRVHDVAETVQALGVAQALLSGAETTD
ncbi:MAG: dihydropteroate synthase, partial [Alphaproteobacteria bacterium]